MRTRWITFAVSASGILCSSSGAAQRSLPEGRAVRTPVIATVAAQPYVGRATNQNLTLELGFEDVNFLPTGDTRFAVTMHGYVGVRPTKSRMFVIAKGLVDGGYVLRVDFQKVGTAGQATLSRTGAESVTCPLQQQLLYTGPLQSCVLSFSAAALSNFAASATLQLDSGDEVVPVLVTLNRVR